MKYLLVTLFAALLTWSAIAQTREDLYARFTEASMNADTTAISELLTEWEKLYPDDAELYSVRANYLYLSSRNEVITLTTEEPIDGMECYEVKDSAGVKGYMYSKIQTDSVKYEAAITTLTEGIRKYPDRLDLRLGKVTLLLYANKNDHAVEEIIQAIQHSTENQNNWYYTLDVPVETDGVSFLRDCIQDYFGRFLDAEDLVSAETLIDACISMYPNDAVFISDKGTIRIVADDLPGAMEWFSKANKIAPDDMLIVYNIAIIYKMQGDIDNALKYFGIMLESGDDEYSELAKTEIEQLNSQNNQREIIPVDWKELDMIVRNDPDRVRNYVNRLSEVTLDRSLSYHDRIIAFYGQALLTNGTEQSLANEASRLYQEKDYANAFKKAKEALEINPLNLSALNIAGSSIVMLMESGDTSVTSDDAMYYFNVAMRIYNTIAITGYGNEEHPFFITTVADEYAFVRNYLEIYKIEGQALINHCDVLTLGETSQYYSDPKIYFDASLPLKKVAHLISSRP